MFFAILRLRFFFLKVSGFDIGRFFMRHRNWSKFLTTMFKKYEISGVISSMEGSGKQQGFRKTEQLPVENHPKNTYTNFQAV